MIFSICFSMSRSCVKLKLDLLFWCLSFWIFRHEHFTTVKYETGWVCSKTAYLSRFSSLQWMQIKIHQQDMLSLTFPPLDQHKTPPWHVKRRCPSKTSTHPHRPRWATAWIPANTRSGNFLGCWCSWRCVGTGCPRCYTHQYLNNGGGEKNINHWIHNCLLRRKNTTLLHSEESPYCLYNDITQEESSFDCTEWTGVKGPEWVELY